MATATSLLFPQPLITTNLFSISIILLFQEWYINGAYMIFLGHFFSLSLIPWQSIQNTACTSILFLFTAG